MRFKILPLSWLTFAILNLTLAADAQEEKGSGEAPKWSGGELDRQMRERKEKIAQLSPEEQAILQAAQREAAQDPAVRIAMAKRDQALQEFQAALRASMLKSDPAIAPIFKKIVGARGPRPKQNR